MQLRTISARYASRCKKCKRSLSKGSEVLWSKTAGTYCLSCGDNFNARPSNIPVNSGIAAGSEFAIDWSELKRFCLDFIAGKKPAFNDPSVNDSITKYLVNPTQHFHGYSGGQVERWMRDGFQTEAIHGLGDFIPPIREKRKFRFHEDADEFHFDLAYAGEEIFMSEFTKREIIPGIRLDVVYSLSGGTDAKVVNDFNRWICQVAYSIEASGIDAAINYVNDSDFIGYFPKDKYTVIRVKKENETSDYLSISPMLSPASYRTFLFVAICLHHNERKLRVTPGLARPKRRTDWSIEYDEIGRKISVFTPSSPSSFNAEDMTLKLREILKRLKG